MVLYRGLSQQEAGSTPRTVRKFSVDSWSPAKRMWPGWVVRLGLLLLLCAPGIWGTDTCPGEWEWVMRGRAGGTATVDNNCTPHSG